MSLFSLLQRAHTDLRLAELLSTHFTCLFILHYSLFLVSSPNSLLSDMNAGDLARQLRNGTQYSNDGR